MVQVRSSHNAGLTVVAAAAAARALSHVSGYAADRLAACYTAPELQFVPSMSELPRYCSTAPLWSGGRGMNVEVGSNGGVAAVRGSLCHCGDI